MKEKIMKILAFLKRPRNAILAGVLVILLIFAIVQASGSNGGQYTTQTVTRGDVIQEVDATGIVRSVESVDLAFETTGRIANINFDVGDSVAAGTMLARIQNGEAEANLRSARAKLSELIRGATSEDLAISSASVRSAEVSLENADAEVADRIRDAFVKADDAIRNHVDKLYENADSTPSFGTSVETSSGIYFVRAPDSSTGSRLNSGRRTAERILDSWVTIPDQDTLDSSSAALRDLQVVLDFLNDVSSVVNDLSTNDSVASDIYSSYKSEISTSRTNVSGAIVSLRSAVSSYLAAESALNVAKREQALKAAPATNEGVTIQQAAVDSANAAYLKTIITAPFNGIVTKVTPKIGETISAGSPVISIISNDGLEVEVNIPEADIPKVKIGAEAELTFDAYGKDLVATSTVVSIDPAATIIESVPTYRTILSFSVPDDRIKPGMTTNIEIQGEHRNDVIRVPQRAVINRDGKKIVEVVRNGEIVEVEVKTGLRGTDGNIEIVDGLTVGEQFIPSPSTR